jgi:soluble lytic murein transglycosylase-like protein
MIQKWMPLITQAAEAHGFRPSLIGAVVLKESSARQGAWNPEPRYRWFWDVKNRRPFRAVTDEEIRSEVPPEDFPGPRGVDPDAEWWGQQASWGLMQIMGAVARQNGFEDPDLPDLIWRPDLNIELGTRHLRWGMEQIGSGVNREVAMLAAYNGGLSGNRRPPFRNLKYAQDVLRIERSVFGAEP